MSGNRKPTVKETIQHIKEIAGNHSDEEIYAMLKECSMDPNETAQNLLLQDPFHEVRRKRDKRKENLNTRDSADPRGRPDVQGRGGRVGRGNNYPRYISHDAGGGRKVSGKENGVNQRSESGVAPPAPTPPQETENSGVITPSSSITNGPINTGGSVQGRVSLGKPVEASVGKLGNAFPAPAPSSAEAKSSNSSVLNNTNEKRSASSDHSASPVSVLGLYPSSSDPVLVPSLYSRAPGAVGTIKRQVGSQRTGAQSNSSNSTERRSAAPHDFSKRVQANKAVSRNVMSNELPSSMKEKAAPEIGQSVTHGKIASRSHGFEKNISEPMHPSSSSTHGGTSTSRPSSNYGSRSQQLIGSQKAVGPTKEWKPKPTSQISAPTSGTAVAPEVEPATVEAGVSLLPKSTASVSEEAKSKLQHKPEELQVSHSQHVILPNNLHVPESERSRLSFGSFDASFGLNTSYIDVPESDKSSTPLSESSQEVEEGAEEPCSSNENAPPNAHEGEYPDHPQSPSNVPESHMPENLSHIEVDVPSGVVSEYEESKEEVVPPVGGSAYPVVPTTPNYSFGLIAPPVLGPQFAPFDSSEPQARDASRIPGFVVQPPFDPSTSYYTQILRPAGDDGRFSPFLTSGTATKYNGNVAVLSSQSGQLTQESGNSLVLSTAGPTPLVTQATGVMQSSLALTQQPIPLIRQTSGVHLSHYPPNYIPYNQYIPFYVPPPFPHYVSNTAFPQQPPTSNIYPAAAAAPSVKYSLPQYKPGTNTGNSTSVGTPTGYAPYNSNPAGYSPNPTVTSGNSAGNEDLSASQFKENNTYTPGQQSEGSVWISAPGREVSGFQANSFYLSPQQQMLYAANQAGHGAFNGIYHPAQSVAAPPVHPLLQQSQTMAGAAEMVGPPGGLYQQPQRNLNWGGNY